MQAIFSDGFVNLTAVLGAAGRSFTDVVRAAVCLPDIADFATMNGVFADYLKQLFPTRTAIAVAALPLGAWVEIDAIARGRD